MRQNSLAIDKALHFLKENIARKKWRAGEKLPSTMELSLQAKVSLVTMSRAVQHLKNRGILATRNKLGIFLGTVPKRAEVNRKILRWESVTETLKKEIIEGEYSSEEYLPSLKVLAGHLGTGYRALYKAIDHLKNFGLLVSEQRRFRIKRYKPPHLLSKIVLFSRIEAFSNSFWGLIQTTLETFVQTVEKECLARNIMFTKYPIDKVREVSTESKSVVGFIIYHFWDEPPESELSCFSMLKRLLPLKKPVVLINAENSLAKVPITNLNELCSRNPNLFVISFLDKLERAGELAGRFLFDKGYRSVCFFYRKSDSTMKDRLDALNKTFADLGVPDAIQPYAVPLSIESNNTDTLKRYEKVRQSLEVLEQTQKSVDSTLVVPLVRQRVITNITGLKYALNLFIEFAPAFEQALEINTTNAWICADDHIANYAAVEFLKMSTRDVSYKIKVMGCYESDESLMNSITSVHFDYIGIARRVMHFILYPNDSQWEKMRRKSPIVVPDAMVIDRGSV